MRAMRAQRKRGSSQNVVSCFYKSETLHESVEFHRSEIAHIPFYKVRLFFSVFTG